jgi:hypothetical protein
MSIEGLVLIWLTVARSLSHAAFWKGWGYLLDSEF